MLTSMFTSTSTWNALGTDKYGLEYSNDVVLESEFDAGDVEVTPFQIITPDDTIPALC